MRLRRVSPTSHRRQKGPRGSVLLAFKGRRDHYFRQASRLFAAFQRVERRHMADFQYAQTQTGVRAGDMSVDVGLRKFMLGVYNKLMLGIALAGALAYAAGSWPPLTQIVFSEPMFSIIQWAPLVLIIGSGFMMRNPSPLATGILYWAIVTVIGLGLGVWVLIAQTNLDVSTRGGIEITTSFLTIGKAFFITASAFGA